MESNKLLPRESLYFPGGRIMTRNERGLRATRQLSSQEDRKPCSVLPCKAKRLALLSTFLLCPSSLADYNEMATLRVAAPAFPYTCNSCLSKRNVHSCLTVQCQGPSPPLASPGALLNLCTCTLQCLCWTAVFPQGCRLVCETWGGWTLWGVQKL